MIVKDFKPYTSFYSKSLFRYLKKELGSESATIPDGFKVWKVKDEFNNYHLWVGRVEEEDRYWLFGARLLRILTGYFSGSAQVVKKPVEVKNFWKKYKEKGICYLDPDHQWYSERWDYPWQETRVCKFCGRHEEEVEETYTKKVWRKW